MCENQFLLKEAQDGTLTFLANNVDPYKMNWIEGEHSWGSVTAPEGIAVQVTRNITEEGNLREEYNFTNVSEFPVFFQNTDLGIYATFNDSYEDATTCMKQRCHTHLYCNGEAAYVMALRMGGEAPHLGMMLLEGGLNGYSIQRKEKELSNDRGDFVLHPDIKKLEPKETKKISWELFWFDSRDEFKEKIKERGAIPFLETKQCTWYEGETVDFVVQYGKKIAKDKITVSINGMQIPFEHQDQNTGTKIRCTYLAEKSGEQKIEVKMQDKTLIARFYIAPSLKEIIKKRCHFIAEKQQYHQQGTSLDGAYLIYDKESKHLYYSHTFDDHNGGRERVGMAVLLAKYLQKEKDSVLEKSLKNYLEYFYRELYDRESGTVFNDIHRNKDWHRLYNYAWAAILQLEVYKLTGNAIYLEDTVKTYLRFYESGGTHFYPIGVQIPELVQQLSEQEQKSRDDEIAEKWKDYSIRLKEAFQKHAEYICQTGTDYPSSEVNYEQSIVAPAAGILLQAYQVFKEEKYLKAAEKQIEILSLFNGTQPDYHLFENSIRHWDGYWFGKRKMLGDTFPHYWSVTTGDVYKMYSEITKTEFLSDRGEASLRGCLNLFDSDGFGSCAMVYPKSVNGKPAEYYDPWANDQDWALYYAMRWSV